MRRLVVTALLLTCVGSTSACDRESRGKVLRFTACSLADQKLSVGAKDPKRAIAHIKSVVVGLEKRDEEDIDEAVDILKRLTRCLEE